MGYYWRSASRVVRGMLASGAFDVYPKPGEVSEVMVKVAGYFLGEFGHLIQERTESLPIVQFTRGGWVPSALRSRKTGAFARIPGYASFKWRVWHSSLIFSC